VIAAHLLDELIRVLGMQDCKTETIKDGRRVAVGLAEIWCVSRVKKIIRLLSGLPFQIERRRAGHEPERLLLAAAMSDDTPKSKLEQLYLDRDAKFDEIAASCLRGKLYPGASRAWDANWEHLIEEAEVLTDNWAAAESNHRPLEVGTTLQNLLREHQEICKRIVEILDNE
jgi:hypothetical protein